MSVYGPSVINVDNLGYSHQCGYQCQVEHEFGNLFKCISSGLVHICDRNCNQRLQCDRYTDICRISKRRFTRIDNEMNIEESRKRSSTIIDDALQESNKKPVPMRN